MRGGDGGNWWEGGNFGGGDESQSNEKEPSLIRIAYLGQLIARPDASLYALGSQTPTTIHRDDLLVEYLLAVSPDSHHRFTNNSDSIRGHLNWFTGTRTYGVIECAVPINRKRGLLSPHGFSTIPLISLVDSASLNLLFKKFKIFSKNVI